MVLQTINAEVFSMSRCLLSIALLAALLPTFLLAPIESAHARRRVETSAATRANVPAPEDVLGFKPGDDRKMASWAQVIEYFQRLDAASDRVMFEELGKTTLGAPFVLATISAPENLARLETYKDIQRRLADPRTLGPRGEAKAEGLISNGKTIVLITCGVHSTEIGSTLSSMLIAHRLAASDDADVREILRNTIILLVPSLNPDGVDIVKRWHDRVLGTPHEGTTPPELYHKYVGHDNNRDWYAFTQIETQLTVDKIHNVWRPQIVHDIHQQGQFGSRLFLPPYMQPVEPNVPKQLVEGYTELGLFMSRNLLAKGFKGITWDSTYDAWTPARAYSHYHGGVRILSETASANLSTPVNLKFEQLRSRDGYDPQKATPNFPEPWRGGEWRLRDITNYMTAAAFELLTHASANRERWLRRFYGIGKEAVRPRRPGELFAWIIPPSENSAKLVVTLERGGVETMMVDRLTVDGITYPAGTTVIRMDQPYAGFAKALLETQRYPDLRDTAGHPIPPYDVTAHTLPLLMGAEAKPVFKPFKFREKLVAGKGQDSGSATPRFALYRSHVPSMDEGWTRWALEQEKLRYSSIEDKEIRAGNLRAKFDTIIIPDQSPRAILEGHRKGTMPEEFTGGLGAEGVKALREFVTAGGTLIALNEASDFAIEQFELPLRDVTANLPRTEFYAPGSIMRTLLDTTHPITKGMPRESIAWFEDSPVFEIKDGAKARVKVIARYPETGTPLLSGWLLGAEKMRGRAALVEVGMGAGRIYLFGFRPQYRAQSLATYPLLFNAINSAAR